MDQFLPLLQKHANLLLVLDYGYAIILNPITVYLAIRQLTFTKLSYIKPIELKRDYTQLYGYMPSNTLISIIYQIIEERKLITLVAPLINDIQNLVITDITAINQWLWKNNFFDYKFILLDDIFAGIKSYKANDIIIDQFELNGHIHYYWVKDISTYSRSKLDTYIHLEESASIDNWTKYKGNQFNCDIIYTFEFLGYITSNDYYKIHAISVYPDKLIVAQQGINILSDFFEFLEELICIHGCEIVLVGFHNTFLENIIITKYLLSSNRKWIIIDNVLIHVVTQIKILLFDTSLYFPPSNKHKYINHWCHQKINVKTCYKDKQKIPKNIKPRSKYLYMSISKHLQALKKIVHVDRFNFNVTGLCDLLLSSIINPQEYKLYYPQCFYTKKLISQSIYINSLVPRATDIIPLIRDKCYPVGIPYYTTTPNSEKLSICMCEIKIDKRISNGFLYSPKNKFAREFTSLFTSIDIDTAGKLGGYKIKVLSGLEWPSKELLLSQLEKKIKYTPDDIAKDPLLRYFLQGNYIEDLQTTWGENFLPIISFIVSYYRGSLYMDTIVSC